MRNWIFFLLIIISLSSFSQKDDSTIFINPEIPAHFPGGEDAMWCFIESNLNYHIINNSRDTGIVWTRFNVEEDGIIDSIKVLGIRCKDTSFKANYKIQNEIIRVIEAMPNWEPMRYYNNDTPLKSQFNLPIRVPYTEFWCSEKDRKIQSLNISSISDSIIQSEINSISQRKDLKQARNLNTEIKEIPISYYNDSIIYFNRKETYITYYLSKNQGIIDSLWLIVHSKVIIPIPDSAYNNIRNLYPIYPTKIKKKKLYKSEYYKAFVSKNGQHIYLYFRFQHFGEQYEAIFIFDNLQYCGRVIERI